MKAMMTKKIIAGLALAAGLTPGDRAVFILHDIEGYEHEEVAAMLGCAAGTSKSQLHKARMKLRRLLRERPKSKPCVPGR